MSESARTVTRAMAEMVVSLDPSHLDDAAIDLITKAFVDCLGCALVGSLQPDAVISRSWIEAMGGTPEATILGGGGARVPAATAALVNGTTGHALDFDDFVLKRMLHPSVVFIPVVLALGEREHVSGMDAIVGYLAGYETATRVSRRINPNHYARGWHSTSTVGGLGAAAAAAKMFGLDADRVATTVAIAASSAAGLRDNFGSMVKPLHAGNAAFHGVEAAELASRGFTAGTHILDGVRSYPMVYRNDDTAQIDASDFDLGELEIAASGITFKRYTCCGAIHAALDAILELKAEHRLVADDVSQIRCAVHPRSPEILIHPVANTPEQGRFSVQYSLAVALLDGDAGVPQYTEERIGDPVVQELSRRVEVYVDEALGEGEGAESAMSNSIVSIETRDGRSLVHRVPPHRPMSWTEIERKFRTSAALALDGDAVEHALATARRLPELEDIDELASAFAGAAEQVAR